MEGDHGCVSQGEPGGEGVGWIVRCLIDGIAWLQSGRRMRVEDKRKGRRTAQLHYGRTPRI